jgi:hypothetical protein
MIELLKKVGFTAAQIEEAQKEGADLTKIGDDYLADRKDVMAATLRPEIEKELKESINAAALKSTQESVKTKLNRELGLGITNLKAVEFEEFLTKAKESIDQIKDSMTADEKKRIQDLTSKYTDALEQSEALKKQLSDKEVEVSSTLERERAKLHGEIHFNKALQDVEWGVENIRKDFYVDAFRKEALDKYLVDQDGNIKNTDGTPVVKDGNAIVRTMKEWVEDKVNAHQLKKANDARSAGRDPYTPPEGSKVNRSVSEQLAKQFS